MVDYQHDDALMEGARVSYFTTTHKDAPYLDPLRRTERENTGPGAAIHASDRIVS